MSRSPDGRGSLTVILRSAGERTEAVCRASIASQTEAEILTVVERPFVQALRRSVRLGIEAQREWTLCVDADVVLAPNAIARLVRELAPRPKAFFACGFLLDLFYGDAKARGVHLYRTALLPEAEALLSPSDRMERPETAMKDAMVARGYDSAYVSDRVLGLHGYGQYYRDIFRTIAARAQKSSDQFDYLMNRFSRRSGRDLDLRVALWGLVAGSDQAISLDAGRWESRCTSLMQTARLREKAVPSLGELRALRRGASLAATVPLRLWAVRRRLSRRIDA